MSRKTRPFSHVSPVWDPSEDLPSTAQVERLAGSSNTPPKPSTAAPVASSETAPPVTPILHEVGSGARREPISKADLTAARNGAFRCLRGTKATWAVKINGVLLPASQANAQATDLIAKAMGGTNAAWCRAWAIVQQVAKAAREELDK